MTPSTNDALTVPHTGRERHTTRSIDIPSGRSTVTSSLGAGVWVTCVTGLFVSQMSQYIAIQTGRNMASTRPEENLCRNLMASSRNQAWQVQELRGEAQRSGQKSAYGGVDERAHRPERILGDLVLQLF